MVKNLIWDFGAPAGQNLKDYDTYIEDFQINELAKKKRQEEQERAQLQFMNSLISRTETEPYQRSISSAHEDGSDIISEALRSAGRTARSNYNAEPIRGNSSVNFIDEITGRGTHDLGQAINNIDVSRVDPSSSDILKGTGKMLANTLLGAGEEATQLGAGAMDIVSQLPETLVGGVKDLFSSPFDHSNITPLSFPRYHQAEKDYRETVQPLKDYLGITDTPAEQMASFIGSLGPDLMLGGVGNAGKANTIRGAIEKEAPGVIESILTKYKSLTPGGKVAAGTGAAATAGGTGATGVEMVRGMVESNYAEEADTFPSRFGSSLRYGTGQMADTLGGVADWYGDDEIAEILRNIGTKAKTGYEPEQVGEFSWRSFFNPDWYSNNVASTIPMSASLIPLMYAGYKGGQKGAAARGIGKTGQQIIAALAGTSLSRPVESALEAGDVYNQMKAAGKSDAEADKAAQAVFKRNLALSGMDAAQLFATFGLGKSGILKNVAKNTAGRVAKGVGATAFDVGTEALEEGLQQGFQQQAMGADNRDLISQILNPDAKMKESMAIGGLFGGVMGGAGSIKEEIEHRVITRLDNETRASIKKAIADAVNAGVPIQDAYETVLDAVADSPEGKEIISQVTQEVAAEYQQAQKDKAGGAPVSQEVKQQEPEGVSSRPQSKPETEKGTTYIHARSGKLVQVLDDSLSDFLVVQDQDGKRFVAEPEELTEAQAEQVRQGEIPVETKKPEVAQPINELIPEQPIEKKEASSETIKEQSPEQQIVEQPQKPQAQYLQRIEEPGVERATINKPQGIYTSPAEHESPHADLGGKKHLWLKNPDAKLLEVDVAKNVETNRGVVGQSAGIAAARKFLGDEEVARMMKASKKELVAELTQKYPDVEWNRYYDQQEMVEGVAGILARKAGYDAVWAPDNKNPEWSEYVALTDNAMSPVEEEKPAVKGNLSDYGLKATKVTTNNGNPAWEVSGNTQEHKDAIKAVGGRWYKPKKVWSFYQEEDPTTKILEALGPNEQSAQQATGQEETKQPAVPTTQLEQQDIKPAQVKGKSAEPEQKLVKKDETQLKRANNGNIAYRKWIKNEYVNINPENPKEADRLAAYNRFFDKWYGAGVRGTRTIDVPQNEDDAEFPAFLQDTFYQAGKKDIPIHERRGTMPKRETVPEQKTESQKEAQPVEAATSPADQIAQMIIQHLTNNESLTWQELFAVADEAYGGTQAQGKYNVKDAYDAMELGVNKWLLSQKQSYKPNVGISQAEFILKRIQEKMNLLPTQTKRTEEQDEFQQFSTPPSLAYVAAWTADMKPGDTALEPSAGIGGLAVFAKIAGAKVIVNELSPRRAELLKEMGFDRLFTENAEQINNILPKDVKPTVVIMNPPFSATAGRTKGKTDTKNAKRHLEEALKRLEPGGRLVAIVGKGMANDTATFADWWDSLRKTYNVRANIGINGDNYKKYGTSFDNQIVVIDKTGPNQEPTLTGSVDKLEELLPLLEAIRDDRSERENGPGKETKPAASKRPGQEVPEKSETESGPEPSVRLPVDGVGPAAEGTGSSGSGKPELEVGYDGGSRTDTDKSESTGSNGPSDEGGAVPGGNLGGRKGSQKSGEPPGSGQVSGRETDAISSGEGAAEPEPGHVKTEISVESGQAEASEEELTDAVYAQYTPQKLKIPGAKPHPGDLAQSAAMAAVEPPTPTYTPNLPKDLISKGKLSLAQLETIVYAGQAHEQTLPDGTRKGFFIGDGTGVGKGREISGIIIDNMRQGRSKAVWVSKNAPLFNDAVRDFGDLGGDTKQLFDFGSIKTGQPIKQGKGIIFTTYDTLAQNLDTTRPDEVKTKQGKKSRLDQLVDWLGKDFDGIIAFDEAHMMQNVMSIKGKRGMKKPAARAIAGLELQKRLPNARVVYVSATGATEVHNLAYAERLGLWGTGTPFANKEDFVSKIQEGGLAAMELVARDMKAMGAYIARTLSFDGVTYGTLEHKLTNEQTEIYDAMAEGWQIVLQNIHRALEATGVTNDSGKTLNSNAKKNAMGQFWGAQQRFFNQVLTSMQMPSVIESVKEDIKNGKAVVMQLVNTNEAAQNRQIARQTEGDSLEDLDLTPREMLLQYLDKSFPTIQYEQYIDEDGNERSRPVVDSQGNYIENQEALELKEELMAKIGAMKVPEGPLEIVLNEFGVDNVAEITGRSRRVVSAYNDDTGRYEKKVERRGQSHIKADTKAFMDDQKQILIFSDAGGTGRSYHADRTAKNQRSRVHYLIQAGWRADNAVQGFGRTHRTNQASAPHYVLVTTNLKGQKRFISSIARRLDQLGALTKGQRQTGSQGLFNARDNLEGPMARDAMERFFRDLVNRNIDGMEPLELLNKMGLGSMLDEYNNLKESEDVRDITKFLNRLLTLESSLQNKVFDEFSDRLENLVESAIARGTLDQGLENYKADRVTVTQEKTVYTDPGTNAETKYYELESATKIKPFSFESAKEMGRFKGFYQNTRSKKIYAVRSAGNTTLAGGQIANRYALYDQIDGNYQYVDEFSFRKGNYQELDQNEAHALWEEAVSKLPEYKTQKVHLMSGALLPIWDRLPSGHVRVIRVKTENNGILLGRIIPEGAVNSTLQRLGASRDQENYSPKELIEMVLEQGSTLNLSNGWRISRRLVSGEYRIEIMGNDLYRYMDQLKQAGVFTERISFDTRFFIPTGQRARETLENIIKYRPVVDVVSPGSAGKYKSKRRNSNVNQDGIRQQGNVQTGSPAAISQGRFSPAEIKRHLRAIADEYGGESQGFRSGSFRYIPEALKNPEFKQVVAEANAVGVVVFPYKAINRKRDLLAGIMTTDRIMYINVNGEYSPIDVIHHELIHDMKMSDPQRYMDLENKIKAQIPDIQVVIDFYRKEFQIVYPEEDALEEFIADLAAQALSKRRVFFNGRLLDTARMWRGMGNGYWQMVSDAGNALKEYLGDSQTVSEQFGQVAGLKGQPKFKGQNQNEGELLYQKIEQETQHFSNQLDKWAAKQLKSGELIEVCSTPEVLEKLGAKQLPIIIRQGTLEKVSIGGKHDLPLDLIKQLPYQLYDPIMVFESKLINKRKDPGRVIITELNHNGKSIVVAIHLSKEAKHHSVNGIATIHARPNSQIANWINDGLLMYLNNKKAQKWFQTRGMQFPKVGAIKPSYGSSILTEKDIVKPVKPLNNGKQEPKKAPVFNPQVAEPKDYTGFIIRTKEAPKKTIKGYKLMRIDRKTSKLYPLFVDRTIETPVGVWLDAKAGQLVISKTGVQKVKSSLGDLAYRPGWHLGDIPLATHIGIKGPSGKIEYMNPDHVWVECEIAADINYQQQADRNGLNPKTGRMNKARADLKELPVDGFYRFKTNPNMTGEWIITGAMKINRVLSDVEAATIVRDAGYKPLPRKPKAKAHRKQKYEFEDQEIQERMEAARGVKPKGLREHLADVKEEMVKKFGREFQHLPRTGQFSEMRTALLKLQKQKGVAADETLRFLDRVTEPLDEHEYDLFNYKVILDDLWEEADTGHLLPFGFTPESLETELAKLDEAIKDYPKVKTAVQERHQVWIEVKDGYIESMKNVGFNVEDRLKKENYYRHQVLEFANAKGLTGSGKKLRTPTNRGFLKQREGSSYDINTDYLQAEYEVMAQMIYDSEVAKVIKVVKQHYDVSEQLKREAIQQNDEAMIQEFRRLLEVMGDPEGDPGKLYRQTLNKKQAIALNKLAKLAARGELPLGPDEKYRRVVERLAGQAKGRKGSQEADILDEIAQGISGGNSRVNQKELFAYLNWLSRSADAENEEGTILARTVFKGMAEKNRKIRSTLKDKYVTWEDLIPDGYVAWQPREGHVFFMANSVPESIAEQLFYGIAEEVGINADMLKKVMVVGKEYPAFVIPEEVALTLDEMYSNINQTTPMGQLYRTVFRAWKQWQLISPRRWFKYNARNMTGDLDAVLAGNVGSLKKVPQAFKDIWDAFFTKDKTLSPELKEWFHRGGFEALLQAQEISDVNRNRQFRHLMESRAKRTPIETLANLPKAAWLKYWDAARTSTDFREALLRYATYLDYLDQIQKHGKPKNWGASNRDEIMGLSDERDQAYKMANELLGAYDEVSVAGQWLANNLMPFWRWNEVNFVRYSRLFKNAWKDGKTMGAIAGKATGVLIRSPFIAWKLGKAIVKMAALMAMITAWNWLYHDKEEKELPADVRNRLHIVLGRDPDGKVIYFSRLGALQDFLDWFGLDAPQEPLRHLLSGKKNIKEVALDVIKNPVNKIVNAVGPWPKVFAELLYGKSSYPDIFKTRNIRDRWQYVFQSFGLDNEYKALTGLPSRGYKNSLYDVFVYKSDPYETAYWNTKENKADFMKELDKAQGEGGESKKGDALYNFKLALRYKDKEAAKKYLLEYAAYGGTVNGLEKSIESMHPLYGLSSKKKEDGKSEQEKFVEQLDIEGKRDLLKALEYYNRILGPKKKEGS